MAAFVPAELTNGYTTVTALTADQYVQYVYDGWRPVDAPGQLDPYFERFINRSGTTPGQVAVLQADGTIAFETIGGVGGGAVTSVNGEIGIVVLDADDLAETATRVYLTPAERTRLSGVATGATANATDAQLRDRSTHTGTQISGSISDLTEAVQDIVAAFIAPGSGLTKSYDDAGNLLTLTVTASGGTTDPEVVRDTIGGALVQGAGISIVVDDTGDTITISCTAVLPTRQVIAGTGLSGGGDLSANRTLTVVYGSTAGTSVEGNDARVTADQAAGTASIRTLGTGAQQAAAGNHTHAGLTADQVAGTASIRTLGTGAQQAAAGNDSRFTNARTPTAHAASHASGGSDVVTPAAIGAVEAVTAGLKIRVITQAAYDALGTKDATTLYAIQG